VRFHPSGEDRWAGGHLADGERRYFGEPARTDYVICVHIHTLASSTYDRGVIKGVVKSVNPVPNLLGLDVGDVVDFGIKDGGNSSPATPVDDFWAPSSPGIPPDASCKRFVYDGNLNNVTQGTSTSRSPSFAED